MNTSSPRPHPPRHRNLCPPALRLLPPPPNTRYPPAFRDQNRHSPPSTSSPSDPLLAAVRAQTNFVENVPLALILAGIVEVNGGSKRLLTWTLGGLLLITLEMLINRGGCLNYQNRLRNWFECNTSRIDVRVLEISIQTYFSKGLRDSTYGFDAFVCKTCWRGRRVWGVGVAVEKAARRRLLLLLCLFVPRDDKPRNPGDTLKRDFTAGISALQHQSLFSDIKRPMSTPRSRPVVNSTSSRTLRGHISIDATPTRFAGRIVAIESYEAWMEKQKREEMRRIWAKKVDGGLAYAIACRL
ncbi:hypothetical protein M409DRAFT_54139 [Zasmidium cellare ATCC 36951]|uniref:Uncharacterized protein n=1 Tax=Zasmidium cellare ATCC 36951 TaxID=1080233 RepID=A0A6A6CNP7_ZASCE|nr:uncharacterized protein M409DRAFT_54139 [Zasmidium cellare ATCC 36951]KAF2167542.1 hypothetical protein M409DRAFT_54139 [Zasmidium cellare ATCC 36951]